MHITHWLCAAVLFSSALLSGCGGGDSENSAPIGYASLSNLYGRLTLNYASGGFARSNSVVYSPNSYTVQDSVPMLGEYFDTDPSRVIYCAVLEDASGYFCVASTEFYDVDFFLFQLDASGVIRNGVHEQCTAAENFNGTYFDACINDLIYTPDSQLTGYVASVAQGASPAAVGMAAPASSSVGAAVLAKALQQGLSLRKP